MYIIGTTPYQWFISALENVAYKVTVSTFYGFPANEPEVIDMMNPLKDGKQSKFFSQYNTNVIWHFSNAQLLLYLWAEGNFTETLLYGNFLSVWTDQVDLGPAHLKHRQK